eukprot:COSAG02_NODE_2085_length_9885_cov_9.743946_5_plen_58_part_00
MQRAFLLPFLTVLIDMQQVSPGIRRLRVSTPEVQSDEDSRSVRLSSSSESKLEPPKP